MLRLNLHQLQFGINLARFSMLLKYFGLKIKRYNKYFIKDVAILEKEMDTFVKIHLMKKDYLLKIIVVNKFIKIKTGSYKGYKLIRGLPVHNQRTKTNSKTARKLGFLIV